MANEYIIDDTYIVDDFDELPKKVKQLILQEIENINIHIMNDIMFYKECCESPIELILASAIAIKTSGSLFLDPQREIKHKKKNYRVDFIINKEPFNYYLNNNLKLVIECDGYDFHQKTKKQVDYDNQREYDLKMEGYEILRFSGTEIFNKPFECADKVLSFIKKKNE